MTSPAPGPWHVGACIPRGSGDGDYTIEDANGRRIALLGDGGECTLGDPEAEATAQMLAAAPDLAKVLQRIAAHDHITGCGRQLDHLFNSWIDEARAALAKVGAS